MIGSIIDWSAMRVYWRASNALARLSRLARVFFWKISIGVVRIKSRAGLHPAAAQEKTLQDSFAETLIIHTNPRDLKWQHTCRKISQIQ
jgi:hypothetical protein